MLALKINDVKSFMNQLLIGDTFDSFSLVEASITTFSNFTIDGKIHKDFFDTDFQISTDQIRGLNLNLQYKNNELFCTTGISSDTFLLDRHPEITWDSAVPKFFQKHRLDFDRL